MPIKFAKPPLIEAACELRFDPSGAWDLTIPGRLFDKLQPEFPERKQLLAVELTVKAADKPEYRQIENLQFLSKDGKNVVQIREHSVALSRLAPYPGWENYSPLVEKVLKSYIALSGEETIARLGLKYVNRISIPQATIEMGDYFDLYPHVGKKLPQQHGPFLLGVVLPGSDETSDLRIELATAKQETQDAIVLMFSLDHYTNGTQAINVANVAEWLEKGHDKIEETFYAVLKEPTLRLFDPLPEINNADSKRN